MAKLADDQILVGSKPFLKYVKSVEILFKNKGLKEITLKARGKNIQKAVDLAEGCKNKFCKDLNLKIANISSKTESFKREDGGEISVSVLWIILKK